LYLAGTVPAKPVAARRWAAKVKAMIRDAVAKNDLIIKMQPFTLSVKARRIGWPEQMLQHSTGAAEYPILYTGT
jgi:hypothetical protein